MGNKKLSADKTILISTKKNFWFWLNLINSQKNTVWAFWIFLSVYSASINSFSSQFVQFQTFLCCFNCSCICTHRWYFFFLGLWGKYFENTMCVLRSQNLCLDLINHSGSLEHFQNILIFLQNYGLQFHAADSVHCTEQISKTLEPISIYAYTVISITTFIFLIVTFIP